MGCSTKLPVSQVVVKELKNKEYQMKAKISSFLLMLKMLYGSMKKYMEKLERKHIF